MLKCENKKCETIHDGNYGSGRFCSRSCSNSRIRTDEIKRKISDTLKDTMHLRRWPSKDSWSEERRENFKKAIEKCKETWLTKLMTKDFAKLGHDSASKRVKLEQNGRCNKCGIDEWLGEKITLELEHKDGNNSNNSRENLEALCPNCHSQTSTWRGRNKQSNNFIKKHKISDEEFLESLLKNKNNIRQALIELGLSPKGGHYKRAHRILVMSN